MAEQGQPGAPHASFQPAGERQAGSPQNGSVTPPHPAPGPGSRRPAIRNYNPEGKPWEACQLSFQDQALGEAEI